MSKNGKMMWNAEKGIYEPEEDPRQYVTGSMAYNHTKGIWQPRDDDPHNMYGSNYMHNASQTMSYDNNTMQWQQKTQQQQQPTKPTKSTKKK